MTNKRKKYLSIYAKVHSFTTIGIEGIPIEVECVQRFQLPGFQIVGLASSSARDARERVQTALATVGYPLPSRKVIVNLGPAWIEKEGAAYDLAIAIACLASMGIIPEEKIRNIAILGELTLQGEIKPVQSIFALPSMLRKEYFAGAIIPSEKKISLISRQLCIGGSFSHLSEVIDYLLQGKRVNSLISNSISIPPCEDANARVSLDDIVGQDTAKRALQIAAAGEHTTILAGPRGIGKSFLSSAYHDILPMLTEEEKEIISSIYAAKSLEWDGKRPYRSPHHTITPTAFLGGGLRCEPGEISLAHGGVLFLDEFLEFSRTVLEAMRVPLESGSIHLARASVSTIIPARVYLLGATNLCPCGLLGDPKFDCRCNSGAIHTYYRRLSYALQDRIDLTVLMKPISDQAFAKNVVVEHEEIKRTVEKARKRMILRQGVPNGRLVSSLIPRSLPISSNANRILQKANEKYNYSMRSSIAILRVALTNADLEEDTCIREHHILEAISHKQDIFRRMPV